MQVAAYAPSWRRHFYVVAGFSFLGEAFCIECLIFRTSSCLFITVKDVLSGFSPVHRRHFLSFRAICRKLSPTDYCQFIRHRITKLHSSRAVVTYKLQIHSIDCLQPLATQQCGSDQLCHDTGFLHEAWALLVFAVAAANYLTADAIAGQPYWSATIYIPEINNKSSLALYRKKIASFKQISLA